MLTEADDGCCQSPHASDMQDLAQAERAGLCIPSNVKAASRVPWYFPDPAPWKRPAMMDRAGPEPSTAWHAIVVALDHVVVLQ